MPKATTHQYQLRSTTRETDSEVEDFTLSVEEESEIGRMTYAIENQAHHPSIVSRARNHRSVPSETTKSTTDDKQNKLCELAMNESTVNSQQRHESRPKQKAHTIN